MFLPCTDEFFFQIPGSNLKEVNNLWIGYGKDSGFFLVNANFSSKIYWLIAIENFSLTFNGPREYSGKYTLRKGFVNGHCWFSSGYHNLFWSTSNRKWILTTVSTPLGIIPYVGQTNMSYDLQRLANIGHPYFEQNGGDLSESNLNGKMKMLFHTYDGAKGTYELTITDPSVIYKSDELYGEYTNSAGAKKYVGAAVYSSLIENKTVYFILHYALNKYTVEIRTIYAIDAYYSYEYDYRKGYIRTNNYDIKYNEKQKKYIIGTYESSDGWWEGTRLKKDSSTTFKFILPKQSEAKKKADIIITFTGNYAATDTEAFQAIGEAATW